MKNLLAMSALLAALMLAGPALQAQAQYPDVPAVYQQPQGWRGVLTASDQAKFDKYYTKWVDANRKNDADDIADNARHMQEIMMRYNIPSNVPFDQIASNGVPGAYPAGAYPNGPYPAYGWQGRLSADDQRQFDKDYSKWVDATRENNQEAMVSHARKMQDIMARYNIPPDVPFAQVASGGYAGAYPNGAYPNGAYGYPYPQPQRLSAHDQDNFDKAYKKWVDARRKRDQDDIDHNARKMQDIMARYNIPANVPFDQIASPGAAYR